MSILFGGFAQQGREAAAKTRFQLSDKSSDWLNFGYVVIVGWMFWQCEQLHSLSSTVVVRAASG